MRNYWQALRQFDKSIYLYLLFWCMVAFGYFGVVGVLMNLYLLRLGYGPEFIGLVLGSGQLVWALFALPAGAIGNRLGAKQAMVAGMLVIAAGNGLMLAAEALPNDQRSNGIVITWMISWVGSALAAVNAAPYLMAVTNDQTRGFAFSAQQTVMAAAGFAGSLAAGILPGIAAGQMGLSLDHPAPYRLVLLLAPIAYLVGAVAFLRAEPAGHITQQAETVNALRAPVGLFLVLGLIIATQAFSEGTVRAFFNVFLDTSLRVTTEQIGGIMGIAQLLMVLISLAIPAVLIRWGTGGSLAITTLGLSVFILVLCVVSTAFGAGLAYLGISSMLTVMATARGIYGQEIVAPRWRMTVSAISTIGLALGWASAAWLGGSLVKSVGFQGLFLLGAFFALISTGLLVVWVRGTKARAQKESDAADQDVIAVTGEVEEP